MTDSVQVPNGADAELQALGNRQLLDEFDPPSYRIRPLLEAVLVSIGVMAAVMGTGAFIYERAEEAQKEEIREGLVRTARVASTIIDPELHKSFDDPADQDTPEYQQIDAAMLRILNADPQIAYFYTAVRGDDGKVYFILDPTPPPEDPNEEDTSVNLLDPYDDPNPEILEALDTQQVVTSKEPYTDQWGTFVSGYIPLRDADGNFYAVLGMDIEVSNYFKRLEPIRRATTRALVAGFFVSFFAGTLVWFLRNFVRRLNDRRILLHRELRRRLPG